MKPLRAWRVVGLSAVTAAALLSASLAEAPASLGHSPASVFYTTSGTNPWGKWPQYSTSHYRIRSGFPSNAYYNRIVEAHPSWNSADAGIGPDFVYDGVTTSTGSITNPCSASFSAVYWDSLPDSPSALAVTYRCLNSSNQITRWSIGIDSDRPWYTGTDSPVSGTIDLVGVATHEFGHATGWYPNHFASDPAVCPGTSADQHYVRLRCGSRQPLAHSRSPRHPHVRLGLLARILHGPA